MSAAESEEESLYAAAIEVRHDCVLGNLSRKFPDVRVYHWCMSSRDLLQASGPADQLDAFRKAVLSTIGGRLVYATGDGIILVTETAFCSTARSRTVSSILREAEVWDIPPIVYRGGWESWRVLAWSDRSLRESFREIRTIGELRIVSMRPIENMQMEKMMLMPASDIFAGLTEKQSSSVLLGLRHGYYSLPSETNIDRLSEGVGLSASTFSEHLRKGESRILRNLRPYLEAYALRAPGDVAVEEVGSADGARERSRDAAPVAHS